MFTFSLGILQQRHLRVQCCNRTLSVFSAKNENRVSKNESGQAELCRERKTKWLLPKGREGTTSNFAFASWTSNAQENMTHVSKLFTPGAQPSQNFTHELPCQLRLYFALQSFPNVSGFFNCRWHFPCAFRISRWSDLFTSHIYRHLSFFFSFYLFIFTCFFIFCPNCENFMNSSLQKFVLTLLSFFHNTFFTWN